MKHFLFLLLPFICPAAEYEFLTPQTVVLRGIPHIASPKTDIVQSGFWEKEHALRRDEQGNIQTRADISRYSYLTFKTPFQNGEKRQLPAVMR